jgi:small conductance mechanosensitive channel
LIPVWIRQLADILEVDAAQLTRRLLQLVLLWVVCYSAWRLVRLVARRIELAVDDGDDTTFTEREQRGHTISQLLRSVGRVSLLAVAVLLTLNVFIDIGPILAGAGILGLAVSFGAQSLVKDVIAGFFYLVEGQFAMGDVIEVAGRTGVVERMTLRMVVLRDSQGTVHMVPNGQITTVSNMTRKWSRAVVDVGVDYETDVDRAIGIFRDEALRFAADPEWRGKFDGEPEVVGVNSLDESAVTIRTLLRTHPGQQWAVAREFRRRIKNRLDRERIAIPFPQRTLRVRMETVDDLGRRSSTAMPWSIPDQAVGRAPRDSHIIPPDSGPA